MKKKLFEKELKNYHANFDNDKDRIETLVSFSKDAIEFIIDKELYPVFLQFRVKKNNSF